MKLYYSDVLMPRKVCALARHLALPVDYVYLDLRSGEHKTPAYLDLNPNGKVPTLVDGATVLWESDAILVRLATRAGSDLWPADPESQADILRWFSWGNDCFNRAGGDLYFEYVIKARFGIGQPDPVAVEAAQTRFRNLATILDDHLDGRDYLVGGRLSVADFSLAICLPYAREARIPVSAFGHLQRWNDRLCEMDAWTNPFPA